MFIFRGNKGSLSHLCIQRLRNLLTNFLSCNLDCLSVWIWMKSEKGKNLFNSILIQITSLLWNSNIWRRLRQCLLSIHNKCISICRCITQTTTWPKWWGTFLSARKNAFCSFVAIWLCSFWLIFKDLIQSRHRVPPYGLSYALSILLIWCFYKELRKTVKIWFWNWLSCSYR